MSSVGTKINRYVEQMENGEKVPSLRHQVHFKNQIYGYIQDINTQSYLVRKMSTTYLTVSEKYILPPVRKLGLMLEADDKESKKLRAQIGTQTKAASRELNTLFANQKREFLSSMIKRRDELEEMYRPIFDKIPEERQREIEEEVKETAAAIPASLIDIRTTGTDQIAGLQGNLASYLDVE